VSTGDHIGATVTAHMRPHPGALVNAGSVCADDAGWRSLYLPGETGRVSTAAAAGYGTPLAGCSMPGLSGNFC
jgi:hypothetical protein